MSRVSIMIRHSHHTQDSVDDIHNTLMSLMRQQYPDWECIVIDETEAVLPSPELEACHSIRFLKGSFSNRAEALNEAIESATGEYIFLIDDARGRIEFRLSTLDTFTMVAEKNPRAGLIYSDYLLVDSDSNERDVHLLDYHPGRVRDNIDLGTLWCIPVKVLKSLKGLNETYCAADYYDLRLRISSAYDLVHIQAGIDGHTYIVYAQERSHDVFDYLVADKNAQLEMETALSEHLKCLGAYLVPGGYTDRISYTEEEEKKHTECVASIVIPVYRREAFIDTAIQSVLKQTIQNIELIIVCNGGPDDPTIRGVTPYMPGGEKFDPDKPAVRLIVVDVNNIGYCLNRGIKEASGKLYIQLDSDDRLKPDAVEKIMSVFDTDDRIGMVIGSYEVWEKNEKTGSINRMERIPAVTHDEWTEENGRNNLLRINGAGAPRSIHIKVIREMGGFGMNDGPSCRNYGEDYDMVLRVSEKYRIGRVWEPIYDVIRHAGGTDHAIDQVTIDRNDDAKDGMRCEAIRRRMNINR